MGESRIRNFPVFAIGVSKGVLQAAMTDPDTFVLATSGWCLGSASKRTRGIGVALGAFFIARRADRYMGYIDSKMSLLAQLIREGNASQEAPNG